MDQDIVPAEHDADIISWDAREFHFHPKTAIWYVLFTIVAAGLLVFAILQRSPITIITFGLLVVLFFIFSHQKPNVLTHQLTPTGVSIGEHMYPYKNIKKFWIMYDPPKIKTLNLETTAAINHHVTIQLGDMDPLVVKTYLKNFLVEDLEMEETLNDAIARHIKF